MVRRRTAIARRARRPLATGSRAPSRALQGRRHPARRTAAAHRPRLAPLTASSDLLEPVDAISITATSATSCWRILHRGASGFLIPSPKPVSSWLRGCALVERRAERRRRLAVRVSTAATGSMAWWLYRAWLNLAVRPAICSVWSGSARCEALSVGRALPTPSVGAPGPFGLADPSFTQRVLTDAGFVDVTLDEVTEPIRLGDNADDAYSFVATFGITRGLTQDLDDARKAAALDALHATLVEHETDDGVLFGGSAWLVRARSRPG